MKYFDTNILSRGYSTKFRGLGAMKSIPYSVKWKFHLWGWGSKVKVPSVGSVDIFSGTMQ